jgi:membrane protease YdiL (CAAX protease family)
VVVCVMLGVSLLSARFNSPAVFSRHGRAGSYLLAMAVEWATVAFIWWGLSRRAMGLSDLIGGRWARPIHLLRDLAIGVGFIIVFGGSVQGLTYLFKATPPPALTAMLPQSMLELVLWVPLSLTGGFCEEVIFRGYLQRQFSALTNFFAGGILLQGIIFGSSHGYQGWRLMSIIAFYGVCFGCLAHWRRSLRPGMFGHALQDLAGGFLAHVQPR